jgi:6-pyruvoyltetrahydropterin/6-carboxytetrahydropterin synthase
MRMRLEHDLRFEAAHWLPQVPEGHRCRRIHGHSYQLTVVVEGPVQPESGWVVDYADLEAATKPAVGALDHRLLNEIEGLANPTSEAIAAWLWNRIRPALPGLVELRLHETHDTRCIYRGPEEPDRGRGD